MKTIILLYILFAQLLSAQPEKEKPELVNWKFLTFKGAEKVYYLPASLKSVGDIFRIKLLCTSENETPIQYTVFVEDYDRSNVKNRVVQVNTYDKYWKPIDQIDIDKNDEDELWVHLKKGSDSYKLYERLFLAVQMEFND